ncbi:hypothetical protein SAMN06297144_2506 [Sphingomonas guangdongensis]|uniref:Uncharacterized protein n=1 Tax=Sphingomonas guangdongensis TaxID=1141890 RepID=A0A285R0K9_9SPHN|nr:hypothetical protein SAMN06297144_2506 [Sphingomonas guangdongensis]
MRCPRPLPEAPALLTPPAPCEQDGYAGASLDRYTVDKANSLPPEIAA